MTPLLQSSDALPDLVENLIDRANELYKDVHNTQEAALDSKVLGLSAGMNVVKARQMRIEQHLFASDEFIEQVRRLLLQRGDSLNLANESVIDRDGHKVHTKVEDKFDWSKLGRIATCYSRRVPTLEFMFGPIAVEPSVKRQASRRRKKLEVDAKDITQPERVEAKDADKSENETTLNVQRVHEILMRMERPINFFRFVINPFSFGQTVENIFYVSFLIRDGKATIATGDDENPVIFACEPPSDEDYQQGLMKKQLILDLDPFTWQGLIEDLGISESIIPTREDTLS